MAFEFPANPSTGDTYSIFTWNGEAWTRTPSETSDLEPRVEALEVKTESITNFTGPTGADGEPTDYNILIIDKSSGEVKSIPAHDFVEVE